jgi:nitroimidazol reductase NimA-like FMN-containing flavoprotein (pyridoxamine 5'-phosphate oxidase superfamily)
MASATVMSPADRDAFLAEPRVGVLGVDDPDDGRAPLTVPIWFVYDPEVGVTVVTSPAGRKGRALDRAGRYTLVVQDEAVPYRYVSVEGPIVSAEPPDAALLRRLAVHYLGERGGGAYADATVERDVRGARAYVMRPEHWNTADLRDEMAPFT